MALNASPASSPLCLLDPSFERLKERFSTQKVRESALPRVLTGTMTATTFGIYTGLIQWTILR